MEWDDRLYGDRIADIYDDLYEETFDKAATVTFLEERARGAEGTGEGRVLELAIGTGRIALPLAQKGITVEGIDVSDAMVERLRAKPGGREISVTIGDFADVGVPSRYDLIYLVFNTIFALTTQDDQLRLFHNVADRLTEQGLFVVEAFVPDVARFTRFQNTEVNELAVDRVNVSFSRVDPMTQVIHSQQTFISESGIKMVPVKLRYIWPSEMDLMAKLARMELRERYGSWQLELFSSHSKSHISVYGRA